jgi:hypothetical protein
MITKALAELAAVGIDDTPEVVVADAGYWQKQGIQDLVNQGTQTLVPPDAHCAWPHAPAAAAGSTTSGAAS